MIGRVAQGCSHLQVWAFGRQKPCCSGRPYRGAECASPSSPPPTTAAPRFEAHELGEPLNEEEMQSLVAGQYGDQELRRRPLLQDALQFELMQQAQQTAARLPTANDAAGQPPVGGAAAAGRSSAAAAMDALASRVMPRGAVAAGTLQVGDLSCSC